MSKEPIGLHSKGGHSDNPRVVSAGHRKKMAEWEESQARAAVLDEHMKKLQAKFDRTLGGLKK